MTSYNIYRCVCGFVFDCTHSMTISLHVHCNDCGLAMSHDWQIDAASLQEMLK
jgi:hypothetical protein